MATLRKIASLYADEIREGIAWIIIWKKGRSWNAEAVWLDVDTDTFMLEDMSTVREALQCDPNAIMVNGYYCGHLGEDMTVNELAAGIRWHYDENCNLLKNSSALPHPLERPADLPDDMPWYELPFVDAPDPYVYDGHMNMTIEDYNRRHELIEEGEVNTMTEEQAKKTIEALRPLQEAGEQFPCPRCGHYRMDKKAIRNAISRHADVYICSMCGTDEAIRDMTGNVLPFNDWGMVI